MKFSKSELEIIDQYAAPTKTETLAGMKDIVPMIKDLLTKEIVENAIRKLERIPEPECSQFVVAIKEGFMTERDNSIRHRLAAAKLQGPVMQGHDLSGKERFRPAGGFLRKADDFRSALIITREATLPLRWLPPATPFVDLLPEITLHYKLFPSDKFSKIWLYFFNGIAYNEASDKSVFAKT